LLQNNAVKHVNVTLMLVLLFIPTVHYLFLLAYVCACTL